MLLFDDSKRLEKALGEEAAAVIAQVLERADEKWRNELATKADLENGLLSVKTELKAEISETEIRLIKWMMGGFIAQAALLVALVAFLVPLLK